MDEMLAYTASVVATGLEFVVVLLILVGGVATLVRLAATAGGGRLNAAALRMIWLHFAAWILMALEFALGADILRTITAPSWDDIGKLAAIAAVRTGLSVFLSRDLDAMKSEAKADQA